MNSLKVPEGGLMLTGSSGADSVLPQAFVLNLSDDIVEQMIQSDRIGDNLELQLGKSPTLRYGPNTHRISHPEEDIPLDLFLTKPFESTRDAERLPHAGSVFIKPNPARSLPKKVTQGAKGGDAKKKPVTSNKSSTSSGLDSDIEALQNGLAAHDAARDRARVVDKLPIGSKGRSKLLSNYASTPKSIPTSPALNAAHSPNSTPQLTATQNVMERKKELRFTLVHELAVADRATEYLEDKWTGKDEDFRPALEKMAIYNSDSETWTIKQPIWRELNVWKYDYETQNDRQAAIDRAIKQYDKQRLSSSETEWQLLLPKEERGKGKCLSRLQANIAKGPPQPAPKIKLQRTDDSSGTRDGADSPESDKPKVGGETMSRSNSNSLPAKSKKPSAQDAQAKRLLSNSKPKSAAPPKVSPSKTKAASKGSGRVLSAAIIENSDSSGDEAPMLKPKPAPVKAKDTVIVNTRPSAPREPVKKPPVKRPREDSDSSSSSGTPLSKRIKPKQPLPAPKPRQPVAKASGQHSQARATSSSFRSKNMSNTSPTKSSPLASSPPTNASDLDEDTPPIQKKRKLEVESKPAAMKRRVVESVPLDVVNKAQKFKTFYQKYEALHNEISALDNPPREKLDRLIGLRGRLENMKEEIYKQYSPHRV
ncbi:hypothetical protein QQS21_009926 [Conoideocrella luteorostrata]|uniref:Uncharacterized protein n=1 Tax=Conoideocrella luteorostrata TaxID=1105319 RepID=A0AAJ0CGB1_9HYPO|nr:hypothetical protein QQS21_009926 [Conoideocrella luteorostrata]